MHSAFGEGPVAGQRLVVWRRSAPVGEPGRVCAELGCDTVLSIYNTTERCSLHRTFVTIVPRNPGSEPQVPDPAAAPVHRLRAARRRPPGGCR